MSFTDEELRARAFYRIAWNLHHFWEEQKHYADQEARIDSRIFEPLVYDKYIEVGVSSKGRGHREHLVPCVLLRNQSFKMFFDGKTIEDVASMLERYLRIAHISKDEASKLDHVLGLKTNMPDGWSFETGDVMARLNVASIELI